LPLLLLVLWLLRRTAAALEYLLLHLHYQLEQEI
jgi:hypothetical protein